jgi:hypothetical protein
MLEYAYNIKIHSSLKYGVRVTVKDLSDPDQRPSFCTEWLIATCIDNRPIVDGSGSSVHQLRFELIPSFDLDEMPAENVALVRALGSTFTVNAADEDDAEEIAERIRAHFEARDSLPQTRQEWAERMQRPAGI